MVTSQGPRRGGLSRVLRALLAATLLLGGACSIPEDGRSSWTKTPRIERAGEWDRLFTPGGPWLGGDGIYSIPLGRGAGTLFLFGDSLFRPTPTAPVRLHRNSSGWLVGRRPLRSHWSLPWPVGTGELLGPSDREAWLWPLDGLMAAKTLHVFSLHLRRVPGKPGFGFEPTRVSVTSFPELWSEPGGGPRRQAFLFPVGSDDSSVFGSAVLKDLEGRSVRDGHVTVYGYRDEPHGIKRMLAARVPLNMISHPRRWRFWSGEDWDRARPDAVPLADRLSAEFSVTRLDDDHFVLIHQLDGIGPVTVARVGASATGPFGPAKPMWRCPEARQGPDVYCYNAKAHPHLSRPGELLVSYNVNRTDTDDPSALVGLYRPRFLRVPLEMLEP